MSPAQSTVRTRWIGCPRYDPHVLISDLKMPRRDGFEFAQGDASARGRESLR